MKSEEILIPAVRYRQRFIRVWTCYSTQMAPGFLVDTESYYHDLLLSEDVEQNPSQEQVIRHFQGWNCDDLIMLAYRLVDIEFIQDDRRTWSHDSQTSGREVRFIGKRVIVYTSNFGCPTLTMARLKKEADWAKAYRGNIRKDEEPRWRRITDDTRLLYDQFVRDGLAPDQELLKLGPWAFVVLNDETEYRPVEGLNAEPKW